jgi:hypothetical protein
MSTHFTEPPPLRELPEGRLAARGEHLLAEINRGHRLSFALPNFTRPRLMRLGAAASLVLGTALAVVLTGGTTPPRAHAGSHGGPNVGSATGTSPNCGIEGPSYPAPPAGFNPTTATAAQLRKYGFPPRPVGDPSSPAVKAWLQAMNNASTPDKPEQTCGTTSHGPPPSNNP